MSRQMVIAFVFASVAVRAATVDTTVSPDDIKQLVPQECSVGRLLAWGKGLLVQHGGADRWWTLSWEEPVPKPLAVPDFSTVLDVYRSKQDHFICVRKEKFAQVFKWENNRWSEVQIPESLSDPKSPQFIPSNTGLALRSKDHVWWERDHVWKETEVTPCPSMLRGGGHSGWNLDPLGDVRIIKFGFLYAGSYGGEFGSAFASYDLSHDNGPWSLIWREKWKPSVQRLFQDQQGNLWAFALLHHRFTYEYSLDRRDVAKWETVLGSRVGDVFRKTLQPPPDALQTDSFVADVALMADGRVALLSQDEGVFVKATGRCPCLFHFDFMRLNDHNWLEGRLLCFDDAGSAYVNTPAYGLLVFHKPAEGGPWRVRQVTFPDERS